MTRSVEDALDDAYQRGALVSASRAGHYREYARRNGEQAAVELLDMLASVRPPAAGTVHARRGAFRVVDAQRPANPRMGDDVSLYAPNGLLAEMSRDKPQLVAAAKAEDPNPPALFFEFGNEDLPPFTASGLDPHMLAGLPWPLRRPVAQAATLSAAYGMISKYADQPEMTKTEVEFARANAPYVEAFRSWLIGSGRTPADQRPGAGTPTASANGQEAYSIEQLHGELFAGAPVYDPRRPVHDEPGPGRR
jgi:hypothetical protein